MQTKKHFIYQLSRLLIAVLPRIGRLFNSLPIRKFIQPFSMPKFDKDVELQFWDEHHTDAQALLTTKLLLGILCFLPLIALATFNHSISKNVILAYLITVSVIGFLLINLHRRPEINHKIYKAVKLGMLILLVELVYLLPVKGNTILYGHIWVSLLPLYFLTYGQLLLSLSETLIFGLLTMLSLLMGGYLFGVESLALLQSSIILLIANTLGFCTRRQLEMQTRNLFMERRNAEQSLVDHHYFLRQLSHHLRQPLNALSCYVSVLEIALTNNQNQQNQRFQHLAGKMDLAIDDLNCVFNRILDIADLEMGRPRPNLMAVDINLLLAELEKQFSAQAITRNLKLRVHLRTQPPYLVYSDPGILSQILSNLIDNAIKYTLNGWIVVTAVKIHKDQLKLHVRDSGIGIDKEFHAAIFKEFFRCHHRHTTTPGLGIGLAYSLKAANCLPKHTLQVFSQLNKGSDFQLCLPTLSIAQSM